MAALQRNFGTRLVDQHTGTVAEGAPTLLPAFAEIDSLKAQLEKAQLEAMVWRDREAEARVQLQELKDELAEVKRHLEWETGK